MASQQIEEAIVGALVTYGHQSLGQLATNAGLINQRAIDEPTFKLALERLVRRQVIEVDSGMVKPMRLDFTELELEGPFMAVLKRPDILAGIGLKAEECVTQNTARSGGLGGIWSRPDFTIAAIRSYAFNPQRYLDVFAFELKTLNGRSVMAVHEALAQTRFCHYGYVACPRSDFKKSEHDAIEQECSRHGIGLITFEVEKLPDGSAFLNDPIVEIKAERQAPDPQLVEGFLLSRFTGENQVKLRRLLESGESK